MSVYLDVWQIMDGGEYYTPKQISSLILKRLNREYELDQIIAEISK